MRNGMLLLVTIWFLFIVTPVCFAQSETGKCRSGVNGITIPFVIYNINKGKAQITGVKGTFKYNAGVLIQDYPDGYFEAGVLFNNLLSLNLYKYFYLNLGIGVYYGMGRYVKDNPFVVRLTYDIKS